MIKECLPIFNPNIFRFYRLDNRFRRTFTNTNSAPNANNHCKYNHASCRHGVAHIPQREHKNRTCNLDAIYTFNRDSDDGLRGEIYRFRSILRDDFCVDFRGYYLP